MSFWKSLPLVALMLMIAVLGFLAPDRSGVLEQPPSQAPTTVGSTAAPSRPGPPDPRPVPEPTARLAAAGDVACAPSSEPSACDHYATSDLVLSGPSGPTGLRYDAVLALGDLQYQKGTLEEFMGSYDKSWGRLLPDTYPVPGNHEMLDSFKGYRSYFSQVFTRPGVVGDFESGWYAFRLGSWLVLGLNSNCSAGFCDESSEQMRFLKETLTLDKGPCTLALMHHPRFSSGQHGDDERTDPLWRTLADMGVDVVLSGHDHHYERFTPRTASGTHGTGPTQYVVGTGGAPLYAAGPTRLDATVVEGHHGILELELYEDGWSGRFRATDGSVYDQHRSHCTARSTEAMSSSTSGVMPSGTLTATTVSVLR